MPWSSSAMPALAYFYGCVALIAGLTLVPMLGGAYHPVHLIYTGALVVCLFPFFWFLIHPSERLPFFEIICLLYGLQYTMFPFTGHSPDFTLRYLRYDDLVSAATLTLFGVIALVAGYYTRPVDLFLRLIPLPQFHWSERSAKTIAVVFLIVGIAGLALLKTGRVFAGGGQIIVFTSNFGLIGVLALFLLQLRNQLNLWMAAALWLGYVPLYLGLSISGGNSAPIAIFILALVLVYVGERRRIPWKSALVALLLLLPFMYAKHEYRRLVWEDGNARFATVTEALDNVQTFAELAAETATYREDQLKFALYVVFARFDIAYLLAHVTKLTPAEVPYLAGESYRDVIWKVIPRVILPDKPDPGYGQIFGHMYHVLSVDDLTTSINFPQMVEMYVNFGVAGIIIGMFVLSQIYRVLTYFMNQIGQGDWMAVFAASLFANQSRIESNFSLVVAGILYHAVLLLFIGFFISRRRHPRPYGPVLPPV